MEVGKQRRSGVERDPELLAFWRMHLAIARRVNPGYFEAHEAHAFTPRKWFNGKYRVPSDDDEDALLEAEQSLTLTIPILDTRTRLMAHQWFDSNGLEAAFPDALYGAPSRYGFYCWRKDGAFCFHNFHATYAAKKFIDMIIQDNDFKWVNSQTIITDSGYKIRAEYHCSLEDVIEYEYKGKEKDFEFPVPYAGMFARFAGDPSSSSSTHTDTPKREREREPRTPRAPSEPRPDGLVPLADIVQELNMDPREARQILRKSDIDKPSYGWAWPQNEVDKVKKVLKKG